MKETFNFVKRVFKNDVGEPMELTTSQCELFELVYGKMNPRNHFMTFTRYGKSLVTALAVLARVTTYPEKWVIVAPTRDKARIIMGYIIQHVFDNPYFVGGLEIREGESLERIRRERSKNRLTFKIEEGYGEVFILSAEAGRTTNIEKALMGFGAPNVVEDESALIPDPIHSTAMRMLGDQPDNFLVKIGNPFKRNHFLRSFRDERYHKFIVDYKIGLEEGRITQEFIDEMKQEAMFGILYGVEFPDAEAVDEKGYMPLISEKQLDFATRDNIELFGELRLGVDVAGGGRNRSVIVLRGDNGAKVAYRQDTPDTMSLVGEILKVMDQHKVLKRNVFVDVIGIGKGVYDRLNEQRDGISDVTAGAEPEGKDERFLNLKAQMFWRMAAWIKGGGSLVGDFDELLDIRYKVQSDKKIKIKSKEEMARDNILSPDVADALALTFARERTPRRKKYRPKKYESISDYEGV